MRRLQATKYMQNDCRSWSMGKRIGEQPRGLREPSAMVHFHTMRSYAKVDHGRFLPFVFWTPVYKIASPQTPERAGFFPGRCNSVGSGSASRRSGLRCPSETHSLEWGDVDWERGRGSITLSSPPLDTNRRACVQKRGRAAFLLPHFCLTSDAPRSILRCARVKAATCWPFVLVREGRLRLACGRGDLTPRHGFPAWRCATV